MADEPGPSNPPQPWSRGMVALAAAWLLACAAWISPAFLVPDGAGYWSWLPSALEDRDLLLFDQWQALGMAPEGRFLHQWTTPTLHLSNHWGPGAAVAWAPAYLAGEILSLVPPLDAFPRDGLRLPHVAAATMLNALLALAGALLLRHVAVRFVPGRCATLAAFGFLFGTPVVHYGLRGGMAPHALGAALSVLVLHLALRLRELPSSRAALACGLACGFAFAVRPQLAALVALPALLLPIRGLLVPRLGLPLAGGLLLGASPSLVTWTFVYGTPLGPIGGQPGPEGRPYAAFERLWTWEPYLSAWHGVLPWTPLMAVGLAGAALLARRDRRLALAAAVVVASQVLAIALLERPFWGAHAFGQRRLDGLSAIAMLGAALLLARLPWRAALAAVLACCSWTTLLFVASMRHLSLEEPVSFADLGRGVMAALGDPAALLGPLAAVPPAGRPAAALALLGGAAAAGLLALFLRRLTPRARIAAAAAWLALASAWLAACGFHGRATIAEWRGVALRHQELGPMAGSVDARIGMLRREAEWLRRRGDEEEARAVAQRADDFERRLREAIARRGPAP